VTLSDSGLRAVDVELSGPAPSAIRNGVVGCVVVFGGRFGWGRCSRRRRRVATWTSKPVFRVEQGAPLAVAQIVECGGEYEWPFVAVS